MKKLLLAAIIGSVFTSSAMAEDAIDKPTTPVQQPKVPQVVIDGTKDAYAEAYRAEIESGKGNQETARIAGQQAAEAYLHDIQQAVDNFQGLPKITPVKNPIGDPVTIPVEPPVTTPVEPVVPEKPTEPPYNKPIPVVPGEPTNPIDKPDPIEKPTRPEAPEGPIGEPIPEKPDLADGDLTEHLGEGQLVKHEILENYAGDKTPLVDPLPSNPVEPSDPVAPAPQLDGEITAALQAQGDKAMEYHNNAMATTQATVNARPMVTDGQTAMGAGFGASGDSEAISVGVAHSFEDSGWSASGTLTGTSETNYVDTEVSVGAGVQYSFN